MLAGYKATAAEEIPTGELGHVSGPVPASAKPTDEQMAALRAVLAALAEIEPDVDWPQRAREIAGVPGNEDDRRDRAPQAHRRGRRDPGRARVAA